jgi:hypothetical protein
LWDYFAHFGNALKTLHYAYTTGIFAKFFRDDLVQAVE